MDRETICPHCGAHIPTEYIRGEANRMAARNERPAMQGKPSRNPYGRAGKPKRVCKYGDPACPCQDGDACHYEDTATTKGDLRT